MYPLTQITSKQLLPVYDKPMIYYPLTTLMLAGVRDILIISTPRDLPRFQSLLGDGARFGLRLSYKEQPSPDGLAQAFILGADFIGDDCCCMVLGDNIFYGAGLRRLQSAVENAEQKHRATVFGYHVEDPGRFGIVEFDRENRVVSLEEKPAVPKSNYAVTGLYFYDNRCVDYAEGLTPSARGELEITDLNRLYLQAGDLAGNFVRTIQHQQGVEISSPEEVAYINGWITADDLAAAAKTYGKSAYGAYLQAVVRGEIQY